jgi:hypothetical protein
MGFRTSAAAWLGGFFLLFPHLALPFSVLRSPLPALAAGSTSKFSDTRRLIAFHAKERAFDCQASQWNAQRYRCEVRTN